MRSRWRTSPNHPLLREARMPEITSAMQPLLRSLYRLQWEEAQQAWVLLYPWYGNQALSVAWVLPLALLVYELRSVMRERARPWQPAAHSS